ncbi:MAG TPA: hypothetical protein VGD01_05475 [Candidatus Elarobacter sp.]
MTGAVLAALAGTNAASALLVPPGDGDLGWQHWLGAQVLHAGIPHALGAESFAAAGAPWVPQEWLFCTLLAVARNHGLESLFALAVGLCAALALGCVALRCARHGAQPLATALVLVFVDVAMSQALGVRVQVVAWALLAAFLLVLELPGRSGWCAVLIAVAWANLHASAMLAPALAAAAALGSVAQGDRRAAARDAVLALACGAAVCATPLGVALPEYAVALMRSPIRHWIQEWHAPSFGDLSFLLGALPVIALAAAAVPRAAPARRRSLALALPFCYLAAGAVRNVPLAAIACAPLAACALSALLPSLAAFRLRAGRALATVTIAVSFTGAAGATALAAHGAHDARPLHGIAALARAPGDHRLFCEDFAWCGPALDTGRIAVFVDGRADPFPLRVWNEYDTILHARAGWRAILRRRRVDAILAHRGSALDRAARTAGWTVADEAPVRLLVRSGRS